MICRVNEAAQQSTRVPIAVNGIEIDYDEIAREVQFHPAPSPVAAWKAATHALVVRALLLQQAARLGLTPQPVTNQHGARETDEEALIRQLIENEIYLPNPTIEDCRRYYARNRARFRTPTIAEASHILLAVPQSDTERLDARRAEAERYISMLHDRSTEFANLARAVSDCPSAVQGGNLGQLSPGQTTPAFEAALIAMQPGRHQPGASREPLRLSHNPSGAPDRWA